ncbi:hypothetical protein JZ751_026182, partial [Albula glossodonta]
MAPAARPALHSRNSRPDGGSGTVRSAASPKAALPSFTKSKSGAAAHDILCDAAFRGGGALPEAAGGAERGPGPCRLRSGGAAGRTPPRLLTEIQGISIPSWNPSSKQSPPALRSHRSRHIKQSYDPGTPAHSDTVSLHGARLQGADRLRSKEPYHWTTPHRQPPNPPPALTPTPTPTSLHRGMFFTEWEDDDRPWCHVK